MNSKDNRKQLKDFTQGSKGASHDQIYAFELSFCCGVVNGLEKTDNGG